MKVIEEHVVITMLRICVFIQVFGIVGIIMYTGRKVVYIRCRAIGGIIIVCMSRTHATMLRSVQYITHFVSIIHQCNFRGLKLE